MCKGSGVRDKQEQVKSQEVLAPGVHRAQGALSDDFTARNHH